MAKTVLDYLELPSGDMARSRAFFADAFGWTHLAFGPDYAEIHGAELLFGVNSDRTDPIAAPLPLIRTDDLEAALAAVEKAGGVVTRAPAAYPGGRRFTFREPGGVEMGIYQPSE